MAYTSQKQLGGILNISDVDADGSTIGTNLEIAQSRAVVFNQTTPNVSVQLAVPNPSVVKLYHILNKGTVAITVNGTIVQPGPAYGLYWNEDEFVAQQVEGVGVVSNTTDTLTAEVVGDGSPIDPLKVNVRVLQSLNNALVAVDPVQGVHDGGLFVERTIAGAGTLVVVDGVNGDDTFTGTQAKPFKTIQKALTAAASFAAILVLAGTYNENLVLPAGKTLTLYAYGARDTSTVVVNGNVTHEVEARNMRFRNIKFVGPNASVPITFDDARGPFVFDNCTIENSSGSNGIAVQFNNFNSGWYAFYGGSIKGQLLVEGAASDLEVYVENGAEAVRPTLNSPDSTLIISGYHKIDYIRHLAGTLVINNVGRVLKDPNGDSIISSANDGFLSIQNVNLLQEDGSFGEMVKTGTCSYAYAGFYRDPDNNDDGFSGTKLLVENAVDIHANYAAPTAYTPIDETLRGHLEGINATLAAQSGGIGAVAHEDTATVILDGAGTNADPLVADVQISSAANNALSENPDGLYVPVAEAGLELVEHDNTETIDLTGSGTPTDPLTANVSISTTPNNNLTKDATGLYVAKEAARFFDIDFNVSYNWLDDDILFTKKATQPFKLQANLPNTRIDIVPKGPDTAPGGQDYINSVLTITKNGASVGTITLNGTVAPVIAFTDEVTFSENDILGLTAGTQAQFNNISISFLAVRPL